MVKEMTKARNLLDKKWEFEANEGYLADWFLVILEMFHIDPEDIYIPSFLDMSQIEFRTTKNKRQQIDYVFRHYISSMTDGLWDCRWCNNYTQSHVDLLGGDWYAIY